MSVIRRALIAMLLALVPAVASAEERILRFSSHVAVQSDSSLQVTETIDVRAENNAINRGIYRDFPTRYRGRNGARVRVGFTFEGATRNGQPEPATTESIGNGVRIRIGDADKILPIGGHRYVIRYRTTRQLGRFADYDELYWNVTGNGWQFPIDVAEVRISLPLPALFGKWAVYTGAQGATGSAAAVAGERPGEIVFRTTKPLEPYEGLTVAAAFPKGVIAEPSESTRAVWWLADYGPPIVGGFGLLGLLYFYYLAWRRAGRNPRPGTIVPIFTPPDDLTPAAMRYLIKMSADNRAFAAALVDMGVRGHIRMTEEDGGWFKGDKTRLTRLESETPLPAEEEAALGKLAHTGESILMEQANHARFSAAKSGLNNVLKTRFEGKMFRRNWGWALAGLIFFIGVLWVTAAAVAVATNGNVTWQVGATVACIAVAAAIAATIQALGPVGKCLLTGVGFIAAGTGLATGMPIVGEALTSGWWLPLLLPLLALPLVISAFFWIAAPTREGRATLDRIAGFKQYLSITERERLDRLTAPQDTPDIFERYLPFAIALGVENRWADRFAGILAAAAVQGQQGFSWYSGSSNPWDNPSGFADSVGSSLSSSISSASTAPGSSSGSSGGGSSGGGGGGGGGGGW